jgi:4-hydroxy-3-methylbut-2-enyl diphosphate reductase
VTTGLLVLAPLRVEYATLRGIPNARVLRTGMGPARARTAAARALAVDAHTVAVAGVCAGVDPTLRPGDVVCANELRREGADPVEVPDAELLAAALRRRGLSVRVGPLVSTDRLTGPDERRRLDALAVDMESAWLADGAGGRPLAVLRVVADVAGRSLLDPRLLRDGGQALVSLYRARPALADWAIEAAADEALPPARAGGVAVP